MTTTAPDPTVANFWQHVKRLPADAPSRKLVGHLAPKWGYLRSRLADDVIDSSNAGQIITGILRRGWSFWLSGGMVGAERKFTGFILEPRYLAVWALYEGDTPAQALGGALAMCLDNPPWEQGEEDLGWMDQRPE